MSTAPRLPGPGDSRRCFLGGINGGFGDASEVNDRADNDDGGAGKSCSANSKASLMTDFRADGLKRPKTRRALGDVAQLSLRHRYDSPGHAVQSLGSGQPVRSGLGTRDGRFLQFLANPFEVHSIKY